VTTPPAAPGVRSYAAIMQADRQRVLRMMHGPARATIVKAPPGAGKSALVRGIASDLVTQDESRVLPIAVMTRAQADEMTVRLHQDMPTVPIGRLHSSGAPLSGAVTALAAAHPSVVHTSTELPELILAGARVVIAPAAKWAYLPEGLRRFAWMIVDEAWQMRSDMLFHIAGIADRALFVGDPGQIASFTTLSDTERFQASPHSPIRPAMELVVRNHPDLPVHRLRYSWRLPPSAAPLVSGCWYPDVPFEAGTAPGTRSMRLARPRGRSTPRNARIHAALDQAAATDWAYLELPRTSGGPADPEIAGTLAALAHHTLTRSATVASELGHEQHGRRLTPADLAIITADNRQVAAVQTALEDLGTPPGIAVSTADRIQGREFAITYVWHSLAGQIEASAFSLTPGRMCVMASRHRHSALVVGSLGLDQSLLDYPDETPVLIGEPEPLLDPLDVHWRFAEHLYRHRVS
jgi:hypothetical protein